MTARPRVKLITLPWELEVPTLTLASLAAATPPEFDVAIVDVLRERLHLDEPVDLVGISASTPSANAAYALADQYRRRGVKVVLGGHHATAMPEEALVHADAVVCGEGEESWKRICGEFLSNSDRVGGIYRDPPPNLAAVPQPRIDLMKIRRYNPYAYPVIASRGCPEACSFCFAKRMTDGVHTYPIAHVVEQIRRRPSFVRSLYFVDDNLTADLEFSRELFRVLARFRIPFGMQSRWEFARNPDDLHLAAQAGCVLISSGYETVNQASLDGTGKRAKAAEYLEVIRNICHAGIVPSGNFMFGFDWDEPDVFDAALDFLDRSGLLHISITAEIPFPGTPVYRKYEREGRILSPNYDDYTGRDSVVFRPKLMTADQLRDGIRRVTREFYTPVRATRRLIAARNNEAFERTALATLGLGKLAALNYLEVMRWHYRMIPGMKWLGDQWKRLNKYRYLSDLLSGTNFRPADHLQTVEPAPALEGDSPFLRRSGFKKRSSDTLLPLGNG